MTLTDTLPESLRDITVAPTGASCDPVSGRTLKCTVAAGLAANGGTATIEVQAVATAAGTLVNTVVPDGPDRPTCAENQCKTSIEVKAPQLLTIRTASKGIAEIGDTVQYTVQVKNLSEFTVKEVTLIDRQGVVTFQLPAPPEPQEVPLRITSGAAVAEGAIRFVPELRDLIALGLDVSGRTAFSKGRDFRPNAADRRL